MSRWQILKKIAERRGGWLRVFFVFTVGPLVLAVRGLGRLLVWLGNGLLDFTGTP